MFGFAFFSSLVCCEAEGEVRKLSYLSVDDQVLIKTLVEMLNAVCCLGMDQIHLVVV